MAALVWDNQSQAFVDAETPVTYNPQLEAWEDTDGYGYNPEMGAWQKVWPTELYLIKDGTLQNDFTLIAEELYDPDTSIHPHAPTVNYHNGYIEITQPTPDSGYYHGRVRFNKKVDMSIYAKLNLEYSIWRAGMNWSRLTLSLSNTFWIGVNYTDQSNIEISYSDKIVDISSVTEPYMPFFTVISRYTGISNPLLRISDLWFSN